MNLTPPDASGLESLADESANEVARMRGGSLFEKPDIAFHWSSNYASLLSRFKEEATGLRSASERTHTVQS